MSSKIPLIAVTLGDPSGVGPEIIVDSWTEIAASECQRFVIGRAEAVQRAIDLLEKPLTVCPIDDVPNRPYAAHEIPVLNIGGQELDHVKPCIVSAEGGEVAYQSVVAAGQMALAGKIDALVTAPLNKAALFKAGYTVPGHTELLGELCGVDNFAMMLYLPPSASVKGPIGLGVVHTTLHTALRNIFDELTEQAIVDKCQLAHGFSQALLAAYQIERPAKIGVAALNPHAGEQGLFGDEEQTLIEPAVNRAKNEGIHAFGPLPCDTLMHRAADGEFDTIVAMYHDQGHIALKLLGLQQAVNVTLGLPIIRTSVAHGTAYDLAWQGLAQSGSMVQAIQTAMHLAKYRHHLSWSTSEPNATS